MRFHIQSCSGRVMLVSGACVPSSTLAGQNGFLGASEAGILWGCDLRQDEGLGVHLIEDALRLLRGDVDGGDGLAVLVHGLVVLLLQSRSLLLVNFGLGEKLGGCLLQTACLGLETGGLINLPGAEYKD